MLLYEINTELLYIISKNSAFLIEFCINLPQFLCQK